jgi:23S rRNA (adenine2503-C2)-methyltransferase
MMKGKKNIRAMPEQELRAWLKEQQEPDFRFKQIQEWIWKKGVKDFHEMRNLPRTLLDKLQEHFELGPVSVSEIQRSKDGTLKAAMLLDDGNVVESVLIPKYPRLTACISSQVGCSLSCRFCATARLARKRNLRADEIYDQVRRMNELARQEYNKGLTNIVFMGMGEPLLNYKEVLKAIHYITSHDGIGMSPSRITLSTAGIAKMICRLADDNPRINLALSLHAADDEKRNKIMPINETNNLEVLQQALMYYYEKTGIRPTLEYVALRNFNDTEEDANLLIRFAKKMVVKINIIEYNPIEGGEFLPSFGNQLRRFTDTLKNAGLLVTIRKSRGKDIDAACGQLANKNTIAKIDT